MQTTGITALSHIWLDPGWQLEPDWLRSQIDTEIEQILTKLLIPIPLLSTNMLLHKLPYHLEHYAGQCAQRRAPSVASVIGDVSSSPPELNNSVLAGVGSWSVV